jgi:hypothetical protein
MKLPPPPTLEDLDASAARFGPVRDVPHRPHWSVMIATYNSGEFLRRTLASVLAQDDGPDRMQIEVVDGCSTKDDPQRVVDELGQGRVAFHRIPKNRGGAHTFNTCIERARGRWVHILHGDDMVLPGFYREYEALSARHPEAGTLFGQVVTIDEHDRWIGVYGPTPPIGGGVMEDFAEQQAIRQLVLASGIVAKRDVYEAVGGFSSALDHVVDWDMWFRLGHHAPVACAARPYALFRVHSASHTVRSGMMTTAADVRERYFVIDANLRRLGARATPELRRLGRLRLADKAQMNAWEQDAAGLFVGRYNQAAWAWMLDPGTSRFIFLMKSWLKSRLRRG